MLTILINIAVMFVILTIVSNIVHKRTRAYYMAWVEDLMAESRTLADVVRYQDDVATEDVREIIRLNEKCVRLIQERDDALMLIEMLVEQVPSGT